MVTLHAACSACSARMLAPFQACRPSQKIPSTSSRSKNGVHLCRSTPDLKKTRTAKVQETKAQSYERDSTRISRADLLSYVRSIVSTTLAARQSSTQLLRKLKTRNFCKLDACLSALLLFHVIRFLLAVKLTWALSQR